MVHFLIDNREAYLKEHLLQAQWATNDIITLANLDIGDVVVSSSASTNPNDMLLVFERKTLSDLNASIKDGRHHEQKARLLEWRRGSNNRRIYYVVEGFRLSQYTEKAHASAIINTLFRDNIAVILTHDAAETSAFFAETFTRILTNPAKYFANFNSENCDLDQAASAASYVSQIKMKKNKNITPENVFVYQLSQIPGISSKIAMGIAAVYPSMSTFVRALDALNTPEAKAHHVENILLCPGRKVGKKTALKIIEHI